VGGVTQKPKEKTTVRAPDHKTSQKGFVNVRVVPQNCSEKSPVDRERAGFEKEGGGERKDERTENWQCHNKVPTQNIYLVV